MASNEKILKLAEDLKTAQNGELKNLADNFLSYMCLHPEEFTWEDTEDIEILLEENCIDFTKQKLLETRYSINKGNSKIAPKYQGA